MPTAHSTTTILYWVIRLDLHFKRGFQRGRHDPNLLDNPFRCLFDRPHCPSESPAGACIEIVIELNFAQLMSCNSALDRSCSLVNTTGSHPYPNSRKPLATICTGCPPSLPLCTDLCAVTLTVLPSNPTTVRFPTSRVVLVPTCRRSSASFLSVGYTSSVADVGIAPFRSSNCLSVAHV